MKRTICLLLSLVLVLALAPAVRADVIVSPVEMVMDSLNPKTVLMAVGIVAALSGLFLWLTRKK